MAFIGNTVQNQGFTPAIDYFNGNGVTVTFTLSRPVASVAQMIVAIDNVIQNPSSSFTVAGNAITFTSAPLSGTNNIWVEYTSLITTYAAISQDPTVIGDITTNGGGFLSTGDFGNSYLSGAILDYVTGNARITTGAGEGLTIYNGGTASRVAMGTFDTTGNFTNNATGYTKIATGTTGQRPASPLSGQHRMNTTTGFAEYWTGSQWASYGNLSATLVNYLVVAGGGGGGYDRAGGGGAGGLLSSTLSVSPGTPYTVTVGGGGAGGSSGSGSNGANSVFSSITTIGGGGGSSIGGNGTAGGSGGGAGANAVATFTGGSGTSGQGNAGGNSGPSNDSIRVCGGGGGWGAAGTSGGSGQPGNGGNGVAVTISGSSVTYAGGGGGGDAGWDRTGSPGAGSGGTGGGGAGGTRNSGSSGGTAGTTNLGGGGGGGGNYNDSQRGPGGNGGSGIVIISYATTYKDATATGTYTKTVSGGNTIYTFTGSGTITF